MNRKEILEIKKQYTTERCPILHICGCYIDSEKNKKTEFSSSFLNFSEEDFFKYSEIFKTILSGNLEKNLHNMQFPLKAEEEDAPQHLLLKLRQSKLKDADLLEEFYYKVNESYNYDGDYLILLGRAVYDIPGKESDNTETFDTSDEIYEYILCCICPVNMPKPCLSYQEKKNCFKSRDMDRIVEKPINGFLFPAFNDRSSDLHGALYYAKKTEETQSAFLVNVLGCEPPFTATKQKKAFQNIIKETLGDQCNFSNVLSIHEELFNREFMNDKIVPVEIEKSDIQNILKDNGASDDRLSEFDAIYTEAVSSKETEVPQDKPLTFAVNNITDTKKLEIKTTDVIIRINAARTDLICEKVIDGKRSIIITIEDYMELEGIEVDIQR